MNGSIHPKWLAGARLFLRHESSACICVYLRTLGFAYGTDTPKDLNRFAVSKSGSPMTPE